MATHIIASSLPPKKMVEFNKYRIVKPAWVTESIEAGKLLPWSDYRVIEETPRQKTIGFDGGQMLARSNTQSSRLTGYREQTDKSFYTSQLKELAQAIDGKSQEDQAPSQLLDGESIPIVDEYFPDDADLDFDMEGSPKPIPTGPQEIDITVDAEHLQMEVDSGNAHNPSQKQEDGNIPDQESADRPSESKTLTSEEHNALLLQDPRLRKSSTANPDFIQQYYSESRLHHLSIWKAELKSKMQKLAAEKASHTKAPKRRSGTRRYIMHVDFDSFFCAVSLKSAPEYIDKPTVVAHGTGNGSEIASCNYPARKSGVKNGMWMKRARELCPDLKILPYDFPAYEEASRLFYESILEIGGIVQSVSIDEALVDVTLVILEAVGSNGAGIDEGSIWKEQEKADQIASELREKVKAKTECAVSVGIGSNILLAKVALVSPIPLESPPIQANTL